MEKNWSYEAWCGGDRRGKERGSKERAKRRGGEERETSSLRDTSNTFWENRKGTDPTEPAASHLVSAFEIFAVFRISWKKERKSPPPNSGNRPLSRHSAVSRSPPSFGQ